MSFSDVVEAIKALSMDEKEEVQQLLEQYLREERREEFYTNFKAAKVEEEKGKLKFSSDIDELKQLMAEE